MSDDSGKLDGLREILGPAMPVQTDNSPLLWLLLSALCVIVLMLVVRRYRQRPLFQARRLFRQLHVQSGDVHARVYGEGLVEVLRTLYACSNLSQCTPYGLQKQEWINLLKDCDYLRFSRLPDAPDVIERVMQSTQRLLWPRR